MRIKYEEFTKYAIIRAALLGLMGILTLLFPQLLMDAAVYVLAGYVILNGALSVVNHFGNKNASKKYINIVLGCLFIALGIGMIVFSHRLISILPVFLGALMSLEGAAYFINAMGAGKNMKGILAALSVFIFVGGFIVVLITFGGLTILSRVFSVLLLLSCAYELAVYFIRPKSLRKV